MVKEQLRLLNCKKDKLGHRHLIHINKFGQITQIPLKTHLPHPHKTHHFIPTHPTLSNLKLLRAFESFLTNLLMCIRCLWLILSFLQFSNLNCPFTNWEDFICLFPYIIHMMRFKIQILFAFLLIINLFNIIIFKVWLTYW